MDVDKPVKAKHARWLLAEMPAWEAEGLLSPDQAETLRLRYASAAVGRNWATALFFIAGLLVAGLGIILLLAHNWEDFPRPLRAALSIAPLLPALALSYFALWKRSESALFREGAGALLATSVAASIALVGQTYQFPGDEWSYLRTCLILVIPSAYVLRSATSAAIAFLGLALMSFDLQNDPYRIFLLSMLLAAAIGYLILVARKNRYGAQAAILGWVAPLCLSITVYPLVGHDKAVFTSFFLFAAMVCLSRTSFSNAPDVWRRGFEVVGGCCIVIEAVTMTFWVKPLSWSQLLHAPGADIWRLGLLVALFALAVLLWLDGLRARDAVAGFFGASWIPAILWESVVSLGGDRTWISLINSSYLLVLGVGLVWTGTRERSLGRVNVGALVLAVLLLFKFFDQRYSFVARGLAFLVAGAGFIILHFWARRRLGGAV